MKWRIRVQRKMGTKKSRYLISYDEVRAVWVRKSHSGNSSGKHSHIHIHSLSHSLDDSPMWNRGIMFKQTSFGLRPQLDTIHPTPAQLIMWRMRELERGKEWERKKIKKGGKRVKEIRWRTMASPETKKTKKNYVEWTSTIFWSLYKISDWILITF